MEAFLGSHKSYDDSKLHTWQFESNLKKNMSEIKPMSYNRAVSNASVISRRDPKEKFDAKTRWTSAGAAAYRPGRLDRQQQACNIM